MLKTYIFSANINTKNPGKSYWSIDGAVGNYFSGGEAMTINSCTLSILISKDSIRTILPQIFVSISNVNNSNDFLFSSNSENEQHIYTLKSNYTYYELYLESIQEIFVNNDTEYVLFQYKNNTPHQFTISSSLIYGYLWANDYGKELDSEIFENIYPDAPGFPRFCRLKNFSYKLDPLDNYYNNVTLTFNLTRTN